MSVFDRDEHDGQLWITMKYVNGTDASELLRSHPRGLPAADVVAVVTAVAEALDHAHRQGLLHRDVKPANILIAGGAPGSSKRRILLADFGIARPIIDDTHITSTNLTVGSIAYTSPEQLAGGPLDGRADQYSLACTAYQLLCGATPFADSNAAMLIHQHLSVTPPAVTGKRTGLSGQVDRVLARALDKEPGRRYSSCEHFAADLAAALRSSPSANAGGATLLAPSGSAPVAPRANSRADLPRPSSSPSAPQARPPSRPAPAVRPAPVPAFPPSGYAAVPAARSDGKATAALIMGVLSLTVGWCGLGILLAPLAIVLGLLSMRDSDRAPLPASNRGAATAGVITGIVGLLLLVGFIVLAVVSDSSSA
ncbi:serine/threonine protein kinase [Gordonia sp. NPDC003950]